MLDDRYHGTTDPYTLVNGGAGVRWAHNRLTTSVKVINLFNENALQHVFGDILKRQVVGELRVNSEGDGIGRAGGCGECG